MAEGTGLGEIGPAGDEPGQRVTIVLGDLAQEVVAETDPRQRELLTAVTAAWEAGDLPRRRRRGWTGGSVGSGIDPVMTSEIIYPLLTGTLGQVLGTAVLTAPRRWWRRGRHRDVQAAPAVQVALDSEQIETLRTEWISYGMTLGLSRARATVLAEAIHGALCRAMAQSQRRP